MRRDAFLAKTEKVTFDLGVNHDETVRIAQKKEKLLYIGTN
jgi:hypothetical protein